MTELNRALTEIRAIRRQVARTTEFRGYGPLTLFVTAGVAVAGGVVQASRLPEPANHPVEYLALWLSVGVISAGLIATQTLMRASRLHGGMADEMIRMAVAQFLPAGVVGVVLPFVLLHVSYGVLWMLPGFWQIVFSLGIFASCRCLPRPMLIVGVWFMVTGLMCIARGDSLALAPVGMAIPFGIGMALVGAIHSLSAKGRSTDEKQE